LHLAMAVTIVIVEEARRWREELSLPEGLHPWKVEVAPQTTETPCSRVVRARRQLRRRMCR
jgi:hypothetical protein